MNFLVTYKDAHKKFLKGLDQLSDWKIVYFGTTRRNPMRFLQKILFYQHFNMLVYFRLNPETVSIKS